MWTEYTIILPIRPEFCFTCFGSSDQKKIDSRFCIWLAQGYPLKALLGLTPRNDKSILRGKREIDGCAKSYSNNVLS